MSMKPGDEITTKNIVASSYCNARLNTNKDVITIIPNLRSYFFEWGIAYFLLGMLHIYVGKSLAVGAKP